MWSGEVIGRDDISVRVGQKLSVTRQKLGLVEEPRDSIHLNKMLNVVLFLKSPMCDMKFLVAVQSSPAPGLAARYKAAAKAFEAGDHREEAIARIEILLLLNFSPKRVFG